MNSSSKSNRPKSRARDSAAVQLIRSKISSLYAKEPDVRDELLDTRNDEHRTSKHQRFMQELSTSGKSLADIQTNWHNYYQSLPDHEKHQVWNEFYQVHGKVTARSPLPQEFEPQKQPSQYNQVPHQPGASIKHTASKRKAQKRNAHSLLFGLSMGGLVIVVLLFGFFNERFIAPLITPSRSVSNTSIIIDPSSTAVGPESKIIIPKINAEIPVVYDEKTTNEQAIQKALERGVIHYATTPLPGEKGNGAIFGHSSNNILNQGRYKFAFVLLKQLENGDTFILQRGGKRYVYRVYEKKVVKPTDFSVLGSTNKPATFTLITCDPPGTSINRLVVVGEQITPDPNQNVASSAPSSATANPALLPGNAPTLWQRIKTWLTT